VVNPDTIIRQYGVDSLRLYELFLGPPDAMKPWDINDIEKILCIDHEGKLRNFKKR
jgi:leucyl-tRNA synthetase